MDLIQTEAVLYAILDASTFNRCVVCFQTTNNVFCDSLNGMDFSPWMDRLATQLSIEDLHRQDIPACEQILRRLPDWFGIESADVRGRGLGRTVLTEAMCRLCQLGATPVVVETDDYRHTAFALYESTGFQVTQNVLVYRKDYDRNGD